MEPAEPGAATRSWPGPTPYPPQQPEGSDVVRVMRCSLVALAAALILLGAPAAGAQDQIVARVDGKPITDSDMKFAEAEIGSDLGPLPAGTRRRVLLEFLIENQLFADAAERQSLGSAAALDRTQYWRRRALRDAFFDRNVKDAVMNGDARAFYAQHYGATKPQEEVRARHILVASKAKARELFETIAYGTDFAEVARKHSKDPVSKDRGGDLGFLARGQMAPKFDEVAFNLKNGEVAQPFETELGWHIVKVETRRQRTKPPFETVESTIRAAMIHHKAQQIAADLRGRAQIEYIDPEIRRTMDAERSSAARKQ